MKPNDKTIEQFKNGIFNLGTNFGELAQLMIKELKSYKKADGKYYDLLDNKSQKIEVKFSRAKKKLKSLKKSNILDLCMSSASGSRVINESQATKITFDCNIQQIKPSEFDFLYYGIFFYDKIVIFKAKSKDVTGIKGYSLQHSGGVEYQFHINKSNYQYHKDNFYSEEITYEHLYELFDKK